MQPLFYIYYDIAIIAFIGDISLRSFTLSEKSSTFHSGRFLSCILSYFSLAFGIYRTIEKYKSQ